MVRQQAVYKVYSSDVHGRIFQKAVKLILDVSGAMPLQTEKGKATEIFSSVNGIQGMKTSPFFNLLNISSQSSMVPDLEKNHLLYTANLPKHMLECTGRFFCFYSWNK